MKQVFVIPLIVVLSALLGYGALRGFGWRAWPHELAATGIACALAGTAAIIPALIQRPNGQAAVVQGAFLGMIVHFGLTVVLCLLAFVAAGPGHLAVQPFAFWAMWFFIVTLIAVSGVLIRVIRTTPIATPTKP
jgi:hypothetical protein